MYFEPQSLNVAVTGIELMNAKQLFAIVLTILGIGALVYTAIQILDNRSDSFKNLVVFGILGFIFFSSGVKLLRTMRDT